MLYRLVPSSFSGVHSIFDMLLMINLLDLCSNKFVDSLHLIDAQPLNLYL